MKDWVCGRCNVPWYLDRCDDPIVVVTGDIPRQGRANRTVDPALKRASSAIEAGESPWPDLMTAGVMNWLAHDRSAAEEEFGPTFYTPPRHTIYLSGVECATTRENADRDDLGILVQPATNSYVKKLPGYARFAADNGCFSQGANFDEQKWRRWVDTLPRDRCLFVSAPDVYDPVRQVGDPVATWERGRKILPWIRSLGHRAALVGQDGMEDLEIEWDAFDTLFIGGSTPWKLSPSVIRLGELARAHGLWTHIGRVNSEKRLVWAHRAGYDSVDGTWLRYPRVNGPKLIAALNVLNASHDQPELFEVA